MIPRTISTDAASWTSSGCSSEHDHDDATDDDDQDVGDEGELDFLKHFHEPEHGAWNPAAVAGEGRVSSSTECLPFFAGLQSDDTSIDAATTTTTTTSTSSNNISSHGPSTSTAFDGEGEMDSFYLLLPGGGGGSGSGGGNSGGYLTAVRGGTISDFCRGCRAPTSLFAWFTTWNFLRATPLAGSSAARVVRRT